MNSKQKSMPIFFSSQCIPTCYFAKIITHMLRYQVLCLKIEIIHSTKVWLFDFRITFDSGSLRCFIANEYSTFEEERGTNSNEYSKINNI